MTSFTYDVFKFHPCCSIYQYFISLCGRIIVHYIGYITFYLWADRQLGSFHFLAIVNNFAINIQFLCGYIFISLGYISSSEISGLYGNHV